jgi:hypothetical protein
VHDLAVVSAQQCQDTDGKQLLLQRRVQQLKLQLHAAATAAAACYRFLGARDLSLCMTVEQAWCPHNICLADARFHWSSTNQSHGELIERLGAEHDVSVERDVTARAGSSSSSHCSALSISQR